MKVMITGAARGLGLGLCEVLAGRGDTVFAACRKSTPALDALKVRVIEGVDIGTPAATRNIREGLGGETLDALICNAALHVATRDDSIDTVDLEVVAREYHVNAVGGMRTVQAVLPHLSRGSKIVMVSTSYEAIGPHPKRSGSYGYRMSKAGINTFAWLLSVELRPRGIAVGIISPGPVNTDLLRNAHAVGQQSARTPDQSPDAVSAARVLIGHMDTLTFEATGRWIGHNGKVWS